MKPNTLNNIINLESYVLNNKNNTMHLSHLLKE